jgi:predicted ester cyclase/heme-degrading monooxygenase HmoA
MKPVRYSIALFFSAIICIMAIQAQTKHINSKEAEMNNTLKLQKESVRQLFEVALNQRKFDLVTNFIHPDYISPAGTKGVQAFTAQVSDLLKANPDFQWTIHEMIAEDNKVWARWTTTTGQASVKPIITTGMGTYVFEKGKIIRSFALVDRLSFFQQKNILPADLSVLQAKASPKKVIFIDKFVVPAASLTEFKQRVQRNRELIKTIPGFLDDAAYESVDVNGNTLFMTVAEWASQEALQQAKEAVQLAYQKEGFDMAAMLKRLKITIDRAVYKVSRLAP